MITSIGKRIQIEDGVFRSRKEHANKITTDKTAATSDEDFHKCSFNTS